MRGLYAIVDVEALAARGVAEDGVVRFAEAVLAARPAALQLRDKLGSARRSLALLRAIAARAREASVPLFANDRADLALLAGASGVHVGQDDLSVRDVRSFFAAAPAPANKLVGLSTHNAEDVERAITERPDYLAIGPVFATSTKADASPVVGLAKLAELASRVRSALPGTPIVAIGGVDLSSARDLAGIVDAAAVIGALLPERDRFDPATTTARAAELHDLLRGDE